MASAFQNVVNMARAMGAPPWPLHADGSETNNDPLNTYGPSLTLGGYGETPLQMATGASVLAAQGILHQPFAIARIDQNGKTIYAAPGPVGSRCSTRASPTSWPRSCRTTTTAP